MRKVLITGGAGFIGSTLADRLSEEGVEIVIYDDLSRGRRDFISSACARPGVEFVEGDVLDEERVQRALVGCDTVFHLAANADVRFGLEHPRKDLEQNTIATFNVLEAMRANGVRRIAFSSTGSVYGEAAGASRRPRTRPFPVQTSLYGASKLAGEGLIAAYAQGSASTAASSASSRSSASATPTATSSTSTAASARPDALRVLGDGQQRKSYLYVGDCVSTRCCWRWSAPREPGTIAVFNLGTDETVEVNDSIGWISARPRHHTRARVHRRRSRLDRRQPVHLSSTARGSARWAGADADHPGRDQRTVDWLEKNPALLDEGASA